MSGKRAKALRKEVYGDNFSPRERGYQWIKDEARSAEGFIKRVSYQCVNTGRRAIYQQMKKRRNNGSI